MNGTTTLGRLNKETRLLVQNYENLFTLLQTEPGYLSKLLFCMSTLSSNKFMQSAVFALFDWAQNKREEYLLLKLFKTALQEEIDQKGLVQSFISKIPFLTKLEFCIFGNKLCNQQQCQNQKK